MRKNKTPVHIYFLRGASYFFSRVLAYGAIVILIVLSFFVGLNFMNINVLLSDGLYKRASVIIMKEDPAILVKIFTKDFLNNDPLLYSDKYSDYIVRSINHNNVTNFELVFPWEDEKEVITTERILYINGELPKENIPPGETLDTAPPEWQDGEYKVTLKRIEGAWKIDKMELIEKLDKPDIVKTTPVPKPS